MQPGLLALVVVILSTSIGHGNDGSLKPTKGRRQRRISTEVPPSCSNGCENCSEYNGCLKCRPRLFFLLERNDIRQTGVCLASCPVGYFGVRTPDMNKCLQCKVDHCEECFSKTFCTKCKDGMYSHRGRCYSSCPDGYSTVNGTMECVVQCELGEWSAWGPCMKKNKTCGFKKGTQSRVREPVQLPSPDTASRPPPSSTCAPETESQRCTVPKRVQCGGRGGGGKGKKDKQDGQRNRDKAGGKNRGRDNKGTGGGGGGGGGGGAGGGGGGGAGGGGGGGGKKKKLRATTVPAPVLTASTIT